MRRPLMKNLSSFVADCLTRKEKLGIFKEIVLQVSLEHRFCILQ